MTYRLAHAPLGWRPTTLLLTVHRYQCTDCGHLWRQDTSRAAGPRAKLSRRALRWTLDGLVVQHLTVARIAEALAVSPSTVNDAVLAEGRRVLIHPSGGTPAATARPHSPNSEGGRSPAGARGAR